MLSPKDANYVHVYHSSHYSVFFKDLCFLVDFMREGIDRVKMKYLYNVISRFGLEITIHCMKLYYTIFSPSSHNVNKQHLFSL